MFFKLNYGYYFWISYKKNINFCSKVKSTNNLLARLKKLRIVNNKNFYPA